MIPHGTCVPVFICNGRVFFGEHPFVSVSAWGGGNDSEEVKQRKKETKARDNRGKRRATE